MTRMRLLFFLLTSQMTRLSTYEYFCGISSECRECNNRSFFKKRLTVSNEFLRIKTGQFVLHELYKFSNLIFINI